MTGQRDNLQDEGCGSLRKAAERRKALFWFSFRLSDSKTALLGPEAGKKILVGMWVWMKRLFTSQHPGSKKREQNGLGQDPPFKSTPLLAYFF